MIEYFKYLKCIKCNGKIAPKKTVFVCSKCGQIYRSIGEKIIKIMVSLSLDTKISVEKWDESYKNQITNHLYKKEYKIYEEKHLKDILKQLEKEVDLENKVYLEIGCGPFFLGQNIAKKCSLVIGIDFSLEALKIAKRMLNEKGIKNYILIQGDVLNLPIKSNAIDLIYGGGVIEHFQNTQKCVDEIHRVLKHGGISFNTVPYLNIASLTYRQLWGNIPNFPVLKQVAEFIHIKILKSKHMIFGYEMSFLSTTLKKIHLNAGFKKIKVEKFSVKMDFDFTPKRFKKIFTWLAENSRLFWPMVKVIAKKNE